VSVCRSVQQSPTCAPADELQLAILTVETLAGVGAHQAFILSDRIVYSRHLGLVRTVRAPVTVIVIAGHSARGS
jgi:hypothetical protein